MLYLLSNGGDESTLDNPKKTKNCQKYSSLIAVGKSLLPKSLFFSHVCCCCKNTLREYSKTVVLWWNTNANIVNASYIYRVRNNGRLMISAIWVLYTDNDASIYRIPILCCAPLVAIYTHSIVLHLLHSHTQQRSRWDLCSCVSHFDTQSYTVK